MEGGAVAGALSRRPCFLKGYGISAEIWVVSDYRSSVFEENTLISIKSHEVPIDGADEVFHGYRASWSDRTSIDIDCLDVVTVRRQEEVRFLFGDARAQWFVEGIDVDGVRRLLEQAWDRAEALAERLILLDREMSEETRAAARRSSPPARQLVGDESAGDRQVGAEDHRRGVDRDPHAVADEAVRGAERAQQSADVASHVDAGEIRGLVDALVEGRDYPCWLASSPLDSGYFPGHRLGAEADTAAKCGVDRARDRPGSRVAERVRVDLHERQQLAQARREEGLLSGN